MFGSRALRVVLALVVVLATIGIGIPGTAVAQDDCDDEDDEDCGGSDDGFLEDVFGELGAGSLIDARSAAMGGSCDCRDLV